ncbi:hypothetical protein [Capnocytophaga sputigena]|uniref:hypothetical protein n=1 Tax=Capnocytophaga sputigena TaxID=1019 RepID=UPI0028E20231|nr:hypothetical protein [Capnocytophaga sputigena]
MTGKFTINTHSENGGNSNVQEAIEHVKQEYKAADEEIKNEIDRKLENIPKETPTLSQVLAKGNEMDKDIDIADGKNFNNFNLASKEVRPNSTDTDTSKLYFAGDKTILEHSNSFIDTYSKYSTQKIELDKDGISLKSNLRLFGENGNPDSGSGESNSQLYFNFNGFLLSQENNGQKTEIIKVDSEGIKTKKISQTEYTAPTDEKDYVTKKYVDEAVQNAGGGSRTVQWEEIEGRPNSIYPYPNPYNGTIEYSIDKIATFITVDPSYFNQKIQELEQKIQQLQH